MMAGGFQENGVKAPPTHIRSEHSKTNKVRTRTKTKPHRELAGETKKRKRNVCNGHFLHFSPVR